MVRKTSDGDDMTTAFGPEPKHPSAGKRYWHGPISHRDDFGQLYTKNIMYDAKTKMGPWACMSIESFKLYGLGKLGLGFGQKYEKQTDGRWLKIEG